MDPAVGDLGRGDVLIEGGVIAAVAERIDAPDAEVIDATDRIVMPGFVDNHRHTWQTAFRGAGRTGRSPSGRRPCTARSNLTTNPRTSI
jgi:5-methylthioadenosine/S-adenosylhomocysteine deaminase